MIEIFCRDNLNLNGKTYYREAVRAVIMDNNKILLIYSEKNGDYKLPGGGVEEGETYEEALIREVEEEAGVRVSINKELFRVMEYDEGQFDDCDLFKMLSIYYEVKRKGVEPMKPHVQNLRIADVAKFSSDMVKNMFMYITDINTQIQDKYAKSILSSYGCEAAVVKRLNDNKYDWVGSIFCEFTRPIHVSEDEAREIMHRCAMNIQYLLPEYK